MDPLTPRGRCTERLAQRSFPEGRDWGEAFSGRCASPSRSPGSDRLRRPGWAGRCVLGTLPAARVTSPPSCRLAQLDVDSHLAQCLAESAEDVVW